MIDQGGASESAATARLVVMRSSERDVGTRQIFVSLDGTTLGDLLFKETFDRAIEPGHHVLRVHNTLFWKTVPFEAAPGETVRFQTINYQRRGFISLVMIIGVAPLFLGVERLSAGE
jgi:hypothetical protein